MMLAPAGIMVGQNRIVLLLERVLHFLDVKNFPQTVQLFRRIDEREEQVSKLEQLAERVAPKS